jgi:hypothetical protein
MALTHGREDDCQWLLRRMRHRNHPQFYISPRSGLHHIFLDVFPADSRTDSLADACNASRGATGKSADVVFRAASAQSIDFTPKRCLSVSDPLRAATAGEPVCSLRPGRECASVLIAALCQRFRGIHLCQDLNRFR